MVRTAKIQANAGTRFEFFNAVKETHGSSGAGSGGVCPVTFLNRD